MNFKVMAPNKKLLYATAPKDVTDLVFNEERETFIIAGFEEEGLICYTVFLRSYQERDVNLIYIYTMPEFRERDCASTLIRAAREILAEEMAGSILIRHITEYDKAEEYNAFFMKNGFLPLNLSGRLLKYHISDVVDAGLFQLIEENRGIIPTVFDIDSIGDIKAVLAHEQANGFSYVRNIHTEKYSRFYVDSEGDLSAVIASMPMSDVLNISCIYVKKDAKYKKVFLALFESCVKAAFDEEEDKDPELHIFVENAEVYNGLMNLLNPPDEEYLVLEYFMPEKNE